MHSINLVNFITSILVDLKYLHFFRFFKISHVTEYDRQVFTLLDALGNIGRVNEIFERAGGLIVRHFCLLNLHICNSVCNVPS